MRCKGLLPEDRRYTTNLATVLSVSKKKTRIYFIFFLQVGNSWRTTDDIQDNWSSMLSNLDFTSRAQFAAAPGGWNDADMLEVGNGGMKYDEYVAHFSLWAIIKSPLVIGNDITKMDDATLKILTNILLKPKKPLKMGRDGSK